MFIIIPTYAQISSVKLILKLLRHVSVLIHRLFREFTVVSAEVLNYYNDKIQYSDVHSRLLFYFILIDCFNKCNFRKLKQCAP